MKFRRHKSGCWIATGRFGVEVGGDTITAAAAFADLVDREYAALPVGLRDHRSGFKAWTV